VGSPLSISEPRHSWRDRYLQLRRGWTTRRRGKRCGYRFMAIRYRNAGFTLLEVLITLVIAGLLISLASLAISRNPRTELLETGGWKPLRDALYAPRNWPAPVDRVFIETPGAPPHISAERVIFGAESIAQPVIVTLCKGEICVHIAGSGDGRYRVRS